MKNYFKNNLKVITAFIIGFLVSAISVYAAGELLASNIVYDNTTSGLTSTDVQSAINELNTKSNEWIDPNDMGTPQYYAFGGTYKAWCTSTDSNCNFNVDFPTTETSAPTGLNLYAVKYADAQYGVCIIRSGSEYCFRSRNYIAEAKHVQEVFSDISCNVYSSNVKCTASDFECSIGSNGYVSCLENSTYLSCAVYPDGFIQCP